MQPVRVFRRLVRSARTQLDRAYRLSTASRRVLPDFIILGAQKSGTTSLYSYLAQHPQVIPAFTKEVHFFDLNFGRGINWYRSHFPTRGELARRGRSMGKRIITGEASPYYLFHPHAPKRIADVVPYTKLIALLRNPVDRALSHYHHEVKWGRETLSLEEAIEVEAERLQNEVERMSRDETYQSFSHQSHSYLSRGIYVDQLQRIARVFPRRQILVLRSEDLFRNPQQSFEEVLGFLGLEPWALTDATPKNTNRYSRSDHPLDSKLKAFFDPHNRRLFEHLGRDFEW